MRLHDVYEETCELIGASQTQLVDSCTAGCRGRKRRIESSFAIKPLKCDVRDALNPQSCPPERKLLYIRL